MYIKQATVNNQVGLHARPATFFIQKANEFKSTIWVEKDEQRVNAKSLLGVLSLIVWEIRHALHPERFYKCSNARLTCENCDLDGCRKHKKKLFHKTLKEEYRNK